MYTRDVSTYTIGRRYSLNQYKSAHAQCNSDKDANVNVLKKIDTVNPNPNPNRSFRIFIRQIYHNPKDQH